MGSYRFRPSLVIVTAICIAALVVGLVSACWQVDLEDVAPAFVFLAVLVLPICLVVYLIASVASSPIRGLERARLFLDVLETGMGQGQSAEASIVSICESAERRRQSLGRSFHSLGTHIRDRLSLMEALRKVPSLIPSQVIAMLEAGMKAGDIRKVFPACRKLLGERGSPPTEALGFVIVLIFVINPLLMLILSFDLLVLLPKLRMIFDELSSYAMPPLLGFLVAHRHQVIGIFCGWTVALCIVTRLWFGEPTLLMGAIPPLKSFHDWLICLLPWKRKRLQRDLVVTLAILLDAEVPEAEAVMLAGRSTANLFFIGRARSVAQKLQQGVKLTDAIQALDDAGEFRWRLTNAVHGRGGFGIALAGWRDALDAKAFQQEQAASHVIQTALVFSNGLLVSLVGISMFKVLVSIIQEGALW